jgi:hypothetical protein
MVCDAKIYPPKPCRRVNNPSYQLAIVPDSGCWPLIFSDAIVIQGRGLLLHGIVSSGLATMGGNVLLQVSRCTLQKLPMGSAVVALHSKPGIAQNGCFTALKHRNLPW